METNFRFQTENEAIQALIYIREKQGIKCPKCNKITQHRFNTKRKSWFCSCGKSETTLKARTVLHNSKLPVRFYLNLLLDIAEAPGEFSIKALQRSIGHKYYPPVWRFFHKIGAILHCTQKRQFQKFPEVFSNEIPLLCQYLGTKKTVKTNPDVYVQVNCLFDNIPKHVEAPPKTMFEIKKISENWSTLNWREIKKLLQNGEIKNASIYNALDPYKLNDKHLKGKTHKKISNTILESLYSKIKKIHKKADVDYLNSFFSHHSFFSLLKTENRKNAFLKCVLENCFSLPWFAVVDFIPPHLERLGFLQIFDENSLSIN